MLSGGAASVGIVGVPVREIPDPNPADVWMYQSVNIYRLKREIRVLGHDVQYQVSGMRRR